MILISIKNISLFVKIPDLDQSILDLRFQNYDFGLYFAFEVFNAEVKIATNSFASWIKFLNSFFE